MDEHALAKIATELKPSTVRLQTATDPVSVVALLGGLAGSILLGDLTSVIVVSGVVAGVAGISPYLAPLRVRVRARLRDRLERARLARHRAEERAQLDGLSPPLRERYLELKVRIREIAAGVGGAPGKTTVLSHIDGQLTELLASYLRLLTAVQNTDRLLKGVDELFLYRQLEELAQQAALSPPKLRAVIVSRREILLRRRQRLEQAREHREVVVTQLSMVEDIVKLVRETSLMSHDAEALGAQLNELMIEVESAEEAIREVEALSDAEREELAHFEQRVAG